MYELTPKDEACLAHLRRHGYAVVIITPEELGGEDPTNAEEELRACASGFLE